MGRSSTPGPASADANPPTDPELKAYVTNQLEGLEKRVEEQGDRFYSLRLPLSLAFVSSAIAMTEADPGSQSKARWRLLAHALVCLENVVDMDRFAESLKTVQRFAEQELLETIHRNLADPISFQSRYAILEPLIGIYVAKFRPEEKAAERLAEAQKSFNTPLYGGLNRAVGPVEQLMMDAEKSLRARTAPKSENDDESNEPDK